MISVFGPGPQAPNPTCLVGVDSESNENVYVVFLNHRHVLLAICESFVIFYQELPKIQPDLVILQIRAPLLVLTRKRW